MHMHTYRSLIIATGSSPIRLNVPGDALRNVFYIRNLADVDKLKACMRHMNVKKAVVVGGGYMGIEVCMYVCVSMRVYACIYARRQIEGLPATYEYDKGGSCGWGIHELCMHAICIHTYRWRLFYST